MTALECWWHPPPTDLTLSSDEVHVWRADLDLPAWQIERLAQTLSEDEQHRANRFYFERDKTHFIAGRANLRTILSRYLDLEPAQLQFSYGSRGKPSLDSTSTSRALCFNLSHSNGLALYAVTSDRSIGIDLEYIRPLPNALELAKRFFSPREYGVMSSLPPDQLQEAFFNGWTRKEAYLKATGLGLAGLEQVEVSLISSEPVALLSIQGDPKAAECWSMHQLKLAPGFVAALAVEGHGWHLDCLAVV
jgi:4'-phosphopantetheinyl transferase